MTKLEVSELSYFNEEKEIQTCSEKRILRGFIISDHLSNSWKVQKTWFSMIVKNNL